MRQRLLHLLLALTGAAVALGVLVAVTLLRAVSADPTGFPTSTITDTIGLDLPATSPAGTPLAIPIPEAVRGGVVVVRGSAGVWASRADEERVAVPDHLTDRSGVLDITIRSERTLASGTTEVVAGQAVAPLQLLVGARSITADGQHWAMGVALPQDRLGNPVPEGTPATITIEHPDGMRETVETQVRGLVVWERLWSRTVAGRARLALTVDGVPAAEAILEEVPGPPVSLELETDAVVLVADGRDLVTARTTRLRDRFGNEVADGTEVVFRITSDDGDVRLASAPTVNGVAEIPIEAPDAPSTLEVTAVAYGVESTPLRLGFAPDVLVAPDVTTIDGEATVGPVTSRLGQLAPDGTTISLRAAHADGTTIERTGILRSGSASIALPPSVVVVAIRVGAHGTWWHLGGTP